MNYYVTDSVNERQFVYVHTADLPEGGKGECGCGKRSQKDGRREGSWAGE